MLTKIKILVGRGGRGKRMFLSFFLLSFKRDKTEEIHLLKNTRGERKHMQSGSRN